MKSLGQSLEKREMDYVTVGTGPLACRIIHRQHPSEYMTKFYAKGLLDRLLGLEGGGADAVAQEVRELFAFCVVPNTNPNGSIQGYLWTNTAGQNLNREGCPSLVPLLMSGGNRTSDGVGATYDAHTPGQSLEVLPLFRAIDRFECDAFLEVPGNEALPFNFLPESEDMPVWVRRRKTLHGGGWLSFFSLDSRFSL